MRDELGHVETSIDTSQFGNLEMGIISVKLLLAINPGEAEDKRFQLFEP